MAIKVPKQQETRKKINKLRYVEYYNMRSVLDGLYAKSSEEKKFTNLMPLITSDANILLAYRSIKRNTGSLTPGVDKRTIQDIEQLEPAQVVETIRKRLANYVPDMIKRVEIPKPKGMPLLQSTMPAIRYDMDVDGFEGEVWDSLPEWVRNQVKKSKQYQEFAPDTVLSAPPDEEKTADTPAPP